jgi:hypothetical protein
MSEGKKVSSNDENLEVKEQLKLDSKDEFKEIDGNNNRRTRFI